MKPKLSVGSSFGGPLTGFDSRGLLTGFTALKGQTCAKEKLGNDWICG